MVSQGKDLTELPGIGKDLDQKIREILKSGHSGALDKLHKEVPASIEDLLALPGMGPKRVKRLYHELNIENLAQLEKAAMEGRIRSFPGFGEKLEQSILDNIHTLKSREKRFLRIVAVDYGELFLTYLKKNKAVSKAIIAGSYRRGKDSVGDLDILVTTNDSDNVIKYFVNYDEVQQIVSQGSTRSTVILRCGIQVDLRVVTEKSFGSALYYFTGSKAHNIRVRRLAQQKGLKINEYGVYKKQRAIAGETEESVFKSVGLPYIEPELREDRGEIKAALNHKLPILVSVDDIKGDLHVHTIATDGLEDINDIAKAAREFGLEYLAITDHSRHLTVAHGLNPKKLSKQIDDIHELNATIKGITLLAGIEVDILEDGNLDLPDEVLSKLDLVVAAVHSHFQLSRIKQTSRILRAMDKRYFSILAHPSGRLLFEREPYDVDMNKVIKKAAERGCFLELNSQPQRLDLTDIHCQQAKSEGVLICINSDAHSRDDFQNLNSGIYQARRGWLEKDDILNTRPLKILKKMLRSTMA
jgi:DNA polymerase (family 10)